MERQVFALVPFEAAAPAVTIGGRLRVGAAEPGGTGLVLELTFDVRSQPEHHGLAGLALPRPPAGVAGGPGEGARRDGLWEHTCLECFLAPAGQPHYLEFNLAPDGAWNVYALDAYRQGLRPAAEYRSLPFHCRIGPEALQLELRCPLPSSWHGVRAIDWQVSAVLENLDGGLSHWALRHPAAAADFHDRRQWSRGELL
ncbi:DOMON-like domain-containing protein [Cyanobium sp. NIES-981]|uniref:DOMON-like domain-containing protein n=1 Tax=Cyanobium sp. NIES-981 TaxID=1851505 RepID=UPI0007DDDD2F|nr:DOMON-like domain-containing protein [Cyanobium sp. NIES-981]SBO42463.1 conserved protein of unknown function [Cyanobium sp. NIES-981]